MTTKTITMTVDQGKDTLQIMIRNLRLNGRPLPMKTTATQNRNHVFPTTIGRHLVHRSTSPRTAVAGVLVRAATIALLELPIVRYSPTTTCGTNRQQLRLVHHRKRPIPWRMMSPRNILPLHHQWLSHLLHSQLQFPNRVIQPDIRSTTSKRSNRYIHRNFLHHRRRFLPREKSHLRKRATTTCSMPQQTRKSPQARPRPPLPPHHPYRLNP